MRAKVVGQLFSHNSFPTLSSGWIGHLVSTGKKKKEKVRLCLKENW